MTLTAPSEHVFRTPTEAVSAKLNSGGTGHYYLGTRGKVAPGPIAWLSECIPGHEVNSHFHKVDQYQILFGTPGSYYQRHPVPKTLLHYTDAYSVYGPFGPGPDEPMKFFVMRATADYFHGPMPEARDQLLYRGKRHYEIDLDRLLGSPDASQGEVGTVALIEPEGDGLAAYLVQAGPQTVIIPPEGELRTGRFMVVLQGETVYDGKVVGERSVGWSAGEADDLTLVSGADGATLLFLHMPFPATPTVQLVNSGSN